MAEGLVFNMMEELIGKLGSMDVEAWNVRNDVKKLVDSMPEIKAVVLDAEEQGTNSRQVQLWLEKLKDALDDADDLFEDLSAEHVRYHVMTKHEKAPKLRIFFSSSNQLLFTFKMAHKIKDLRKTIEGLTIDMKKFHFCFRNPSEQWVGKQRDTTSSFILEGQVIGREEEKEEVIELLLNTDINVKANVSVISIVGFGGLGKTSLAKLVYNDTAVEEHFELRKWVCVSECFNVKDVAAMIAESKTDDDLNQVMYRLRKMIEGKRYLLVLDGMWNEDREHWLQLMTILVFGAKGSKIIVTTRSQVVASITGTSSIFILKGLDEEKSWRLFCQIASRNEKEPENQNLVSIGKEIVKKCAGVPLAIKSIASLMYSMDDEKEWSSFKDKDLLRIDVQGDNSIFQILKLSYDHLPFHLKKCFAFCSLFPKDCLIWKEKLIRLWMAQGFVQLSDECTSLEDTGDKYFKDLVHRSFFKDFIKDSIYGDIISFKMHDLVHDLARHISGNDYVLVDEKGQQHIDKQTHHVSFGFALNSSRQVPSSLLEAYKLRTFLLPQINECEIWSGKISVDESACNLILSSFKQFRVLNLTNTSLRKIPSCIGMLKHLRYLDLSYSRQIEVLPRSITKLNNLETLLLNYCFKLRELPKDLWKLISLRHLELDGCVKLTCMPRGIGQLTNLQTLTQFVLDTTSKHDAGASELRELNNLRKRLEITGLECLRRSPIEAKDMNLMRKPHLQKLSLSWGSQIDGDGDGDDDNVDGNKDDIILQGLLPHPNMKALEIWGFGGETFFSSINSFTNLKELSLSDCTRLRYLPQLHVKSLSLSDLPCLEWIVNDNITGSSSAISPSLTEIYLDKLHNLKGWCRCSEEEMQRGCCCHRLTSLDCLHIYDCPNLISIPQHTNMMKVELYDVREKILQQAVNHSKVEILEIQRMDDLKSLSGVLQHLTTVSELRIRDCKELDPCNDGGGCYSMQWKELKNLRRMTFDDIPKMEYLPEGLQHVTTLQTLRITSCANLTYIPGWVTSLQVLDIRNCPMLTSLPEGVQVY